MEFLQGACFECSSEALQVHSRFRNESKFYFRNALLGFYSLNSLQNNLIWRVSLTGSNVIENFKSSVIFCGNLKVQQVLCEFSCEYMNLYFQFFPHLLKQRIKFLLIIY